MPTADARARDSGPRARRGLPSRHAAEVSCAVRSAGSIALVAWVVVAVAPAQAASPGTITTDGLTTTTGILRVLHADDFAHDTATFAYSLRTSSGWLELDFGQAGPDGRGRRDGPGDRPVLGRSPAASPRTPRITGSASSRRPLPLYRTGGQTFHHDANGVDVPDDPGATGVTGAPPPIRSSSPRPGRRGRHPGQRRRHPAELLQRHARQPVSPDRRDRDHVRQPRQRRELLRRGIARRGRPERPGLRLVHRSPPRTRTAPTAPGRARPPRRPQAAGVNLGAFDHVVFAWPLTSFVRLGRDGLHARPDVLEQRLVRPARARPRAVPQLRDQPREHAAVHSRARRSSRSRRPAPTTSTATRSP